MWVFLLWLWALSLIPAQPQAGAGRGEWGVRLSLCGGPSQQELLPTGSREAPALPPQPPPGQALNLWTPQASFKNGPQPHPGPASQGYRHTRWWQEQGPGMLSPHGPQHGAGRICTQAVRDPQV